MTAQTKKRGVKFVLTRVGIVAAAAGTFIALWVVVAATSAGQGATSATASAPAEQTPIIIERQPIYYTTYLSAAPGQGDIPPSGGASLPSSLPAAPAPVSAPAVAAAPAAVPAVPKPAAVAPAPKKTKAS